MNSCGILTVEIVVPLAAVLVAAVEFDVAAAAVFAFAIGTSAAGAGGSTDFEYLFVVDLADAVGFVDLGAG